MLERCVTDDALLVDPTGGKACRTGGADRPLRGPLSTAADFRKLTPLVLMQALKRAGTVVCEPDGPLDTCAVRHKSAAASVLTCG
jgi:hypothetical protein